MLLPSKLIYANIRFHIVKLSVWKRFLSFHLIFLKLVPSYGTT